MEAKISSISETGMRGREKKREAEEVRASKWRRGWAPGIREKPRSVTRDLGEWERMGRGRGVEDRGEANDGRGVGQRVLNTPRPLRNVRLLIHHHPRSCPAHPSPRNARQQNVPNTNGAAPFGSSISDGSGSSSSGPVPNLPFNLDPFTAKQMAALQATSLAKAANRSAPGGTSASYFGGMSMNPNTAQLQQPLLPQHHHPLLPPTEPAPTSAAAPFLHPHDHQAPGPSMNVRPSSSHNVPPAHTFH